MYSGVSILILLDGGFGSKAPVGRSCLVGVH